jgi:hypothetical protein
VSNPGSLLLSPLFPCNTTSFLTRSAQLIFILFHHHISKLHSYYILLSEVPKFQHHTSCAPNVALFWISSLSLCRSFWWKVSFSWKLFFNGNALFNFTCIISYTTEIFEIFHAIRLYLIYHHLRWGWLPWSSYFSTPISIQHHLPISASLSLMHCSTVYSLASSSRSSAHFTVWITFAIILEPPKSTRNFLVIIWLGRLYNIKLKGHMFCMIEERSSCRDFVQKSHPVGKDEDEKIILEWILGF